MKYVLSQRTGKWVAIDESDMDYDSPFSKTLEQLIAMRDLLSETIENNGVNS